MSLHIDYDYKCPECGAEYVPYDKDIPCPNCGLLEEERYETFVEETIGSMFYNTLTGFGFHPAAWYCTCIADHILQFIFRVFAVYERYCEEESWEHFAREYIRDSDFGDVEYMREYMDTLVRRIYVEIQKRKQESE